MSILCDFFICSAAQAPSYYGEPDFPSMDRVQLKGITSLEAAGLLEALRGGGDSVEMMSEFEQLIAENPGEYILAVPEDLTGRLAALDDASIRSIAERFTKITVEELGWSVDESAPIVSALADLAKRAQKDRKQMYLWNGY